MSKQKSRSKAKYKAVIIGAGRIGAMFDAPHTKRVLTHAHAYARNPKIQLSGFFDISADAAKKAGNIWDCSSYADLDQMFAAVRPDIVSICTPDHTHADMLTRVAAYKPRMVICEKPVTATIEQTKRVIRLYHEKKIPTLVNYSRRFDTYTQTLARSIQHHAYGNVIAASGIYTKGLLHNGSHIIDLCRFLFGEYKKGILCSRGSDDYDTMDTTASGIFSFQRCPQFHLIGADARSFFIFEVSLLFEKARIHFFDEGFFVSLEQVENDPIFAGYRKLGKPTIWKTGLQDAFITMLDNAIDHLEKKTPLLCSLEDAFETQKVCVALKEQKIIKY